MKLFKINKLLIVLGIEKVASKEGIDKEIRVGTHRVMNKWMQASSRQSTLSNPQSTTLKDVAFLRWFIRLLLHDMLN